MANTGQMRHGRRGAFIVVLAAGFMSLLDVSIVNVALPSIESGLHATESQIQWVVAGYSLTFGLLLVAAGRAGDVFGRRRLFLVGVVGFALASLGCGLAPTAGWLTAMRLVQGLFAGVLNPQVLGLIQDLFRGAERARAFGAYGVVVGISTALGPLIGGSLLSLFGTGMGWRLVFLINIPVAAVLIPLAARWLPKSAGSEKPSVRAFDPVGVTLLGLAVVLIMWPFLSVSEGAGAASPLAFWTLAVAGAALAALWMWERWWTRTGGSALLDRDLFRSGPFLLGLLTGFSYFAGFTSIFVVVTLYLQQGAGFSPFGAGLAQVPFALASALSAGAAGRLVSRFGRVVPIVGSTIMTLCAAILAGVGAFASAASAPWWFVSVLGVAGLGSGLIIAPNQTLTLNAAPPQFAGVAAGVLQTVQRMGTSIGLAAVTTVFFLGVKSHGFQAGAGRAMLVVCALMMVTLVANIADAWRQRRADQIA